MQLQKEKKHLQKTLQELELARKVELLFMLVLTGLPKTLAHLAVLNASLSVLRILKPKVCKRENTRVFTPGFVFGELMSTFGYGFLFFFLIVCLFVLAWVMWPVISRSRNRIQMSGTCMVRYSEAALVVRAEDDRN